MSGMAGRSVLAALAALLALFAGLAAQAQTFPALTGRVVDAAGIIPDDREAALTAKLEALETQSQRQFVVATVPSLEGYDIADYGYRLGRHWGIGDKERNDGAILLVAPNERKVRIEVGYGLEGVVTDGLSFLIIQNAIVPRFKAGDMPGGIEAGADALIAHLSLPEDQARQVAAAASARPQADEAALSNLLPALAWIFFIVVFIILPLARRGRGGRRHDSGLGPVIIWSALNELSRGGGGGWSSGGGNDWGGGGGFSGGGGSFGGGGSSGSW